MVLVRMVLRKIIKNRWLICCLLLGLIISIALISSIPLNTQAVLQNYLIGELEDYQQKTNKFTGGYFITINQEDISIRKTIKEIEEKRQTVLEDDRIKDFYKKRLDSFNETERYIKNSIEDIIGLPVLSKFVNYSLEKRVIAQENVDRSNFNNIFYGYIDSLSDIENHIMILDGRMPSKSMVGDVCEAMVSSAAVSKFDLILDRVYVLNDTRKDWGFKPIKIKPVGIFTIKDERDPYWSVLNPDSFSDSFVINEDLLRKEFIEKEPTLINATRYYYAFDYHQLTSDVLINTADQNRKFINQMKTLSTNSSVRAESAFVDVINVYFSKSGQLTTMLLALYVPIIIMLFIYILMISRLIIDRDRNEIALLSSRGAKRTQILSGYLIEGLILGCIAFVIGPYIGMFLCKVLGASNGFLEFADRKAIPVSLNKDSYVYAAIAIVISLLTMLIPAFVSSRISIVSHKQSMSRKNRFTLWEKSCLDIILLSIAAYGYYSFTERQQVVKLTAVNSLDIKVDPLLFLVPMFFILGAGLLFLRLYPFIIRFIYWLGNKIWPPTIYATLTQVGRSLKEYHFLMIFMTMTLSIGIFSASAARTLNLNAQEKIMYGTGGDMVLEPYWEKENYNVRIPAGTEGNDKEVVLSRTRYFEPSYLPFTELSGVDQVTKVFRRDKVIIENNGQSVNDVKMMALEPYEFGKITWMRDGLLKHHINEYLNLLSSEPGSCIISSSLSKALKLKVGDTVGAGWPNSDQGMFTVYGIVDYWPAWNPNKNPERKDEVPMLIVTNLQYTQDHIGIEPYQIWLKLKPGVTSKQVYEDIEKKDLNIINLTDANQKLIELKNNPFQLAINGALTVGFLLSGFICFTGFLIYWILSISSRTLQFGIYRAMGLSLRKLVSMMVWEQVLTSGIAIAAGITIGLVTSKLFVPFFQVAFDAASQVPPFRVVSDPGDRAKIYVLVAVTLSFSLCVLGILLSRIKINQAIKLGEE